MRPRVCVAFLERQRAVAEQIRFEISQARPVQALIQINLRDDDRSPFLSPGDGLEFVP